MSQLSLKYLDKQGEVYQEKNRYRQMNKGFHVCFYKETNTCEEKEYWAIYLTRGNNAVLGFVLNCDDQ